MFGLGPLELALIALILLVIFGAKRIPTLIAAMGQGIRQFRSNLNSDELPPGKEVSKGRERDSERDKV